jgi:hypothetical protein
MRTDVVMENTRTWTPNPGNITYSFAIKRNGTTLHTQPKFTHYHHARWHKVVWTGAAAEPSLRVRHHMPYFMASKAVWNYNLNIKIPETVLEAQYTSLQKKRLEQKSLGPMGNMMVTPYFPMTGGRADIGPIPRWMATYLISQDDRALEIMMANADAAASAPIHFRDEDSGQPIDLERNPYIAVRFGKSSPALPTVIDGTTIWSIDTSHQPSFAYIPYLISGEQFYLDELLFWSSWNMAAINPSYRGGSAGLIHSDQIRGQAWGIRAIGEAARITPDNHPLKSYFITRLNNNLDWYLARYPNNTDLTANSPLNALQKPDEKHLTSPWQNDFMGIVFAQIAEDGDARAISILNWMSKFNLGRFQNAANGLCLENAPGYYWNIQNSSGNFAMNWKELVGLNFSIDTCDSNLPMAGGPTSASGYAAYARAMMASAQAVNIKSAAEIYGMWVAKTPAIDTAMESDPTWAIVPRQ